MPDFTPVTFAKGDATETAFTREDYFQYLWDGWTPGGAAPTPAPPWHHVTQAELEAAIESAALLGVTVTDNEDGTVTVSTTAGDTITAATPQGVQDAIDVALGDVSVADQARTYTEIVSSATPTPIATAAVNQLEITALGTAAMIQIPTGTPTNGNFIEITVKDNGVARALTHASVYEGSDDVPLPYTTVVGKTLVAVYRYFAIKNKYVCMDIRMVS